MASPKTPEESLTNFPSSECSKLNSAAPIALRLLLAVNFVDNTAAKTNKYLAPVCSTADHKQRPMLERPAHTFGQLPMSLKHADSPP